MTDKSSKVEMTDKSSKDFTEYLEHCRMNYLSHYNDGYTREYYRGELLKLKAILDKALSETEDTLNA